MKSMFKKLRCIVVVGLLLFSCEQESLLETEEIKTSNPSAIGEPLGFIPNTTPRILNFSPERGIAGVTKITISGSYFSKIPSENIVVFPGGWQATVVEAISTSISIPDYAEQLVVIAPANARTGKISVTRNGQSGVSVKNFISLDIPTNGLVAFYPFDGNANDIGPYQLNGTVNGGALLSPDRSGNPNSSFLFDGENDHINMGNPLQMHLSSSLTLAVWVKLSSDNIAYQSIISKINHPSQPSEGYVLRRIESNDNIKLAGFYPIRSFGSCGDFASADLEQPEWIFLAVTINGRYMSFYKNGVVTERLTDFCNIIGGSQGNFIVGGGLTTYLHFDGNIDDVAVYNLPLSDQEIMQLYEQRILQ
jgi:hypothetical protein